MKKIILFIGVYLALCQVVFSSEGRQVKSINFDWKFTLTNPQGASAKAFDDTKWRTLDLPHDWSIEGEFKKENPSGTSGTFLPGGIGWYRKDIELEKIDPNTVYSIRFDGVYLNSDVWINGFHLGFHPNGYLGFEYDLTPYLIEGKNTIAVKVDHSKLPSGRWYTGSGIYRNVWWETKDKTHLLEDDLFITTPQVTPKKAILHLVASILNQKKRKAKVEVQLNILDKEGQLVSSTVKKYQFQKQQEIALDFEVENPNLWSPKSPSMYTMETIITHNGEEIDCYSTTFGIRKVEWKPNEGVFLNDEPILIKGLSNHQDAGPLGVAVPEDVLYRRLKMLKDMGCNALRTAHHPFAPEFYTMCDTMGFMVMDEAFDGWWNTKAKFDYGLHFEEYWKKDLETFIKRDRNHPSVVIWSVGNEVKGYTNEQQKLLVEEAKKWDTSRPVTQGRGYKGDHIDIAGFNGHGEFKNVLEKYNEDHPQKLIIGTEITHTLQTRGVYRTKTWYRTKDNPAPWEKPEHFKKLEPKIYKIEDLSEEEVFEGISPKYQSSYDNSIVRIGVRDDWNRVEQMDFYVGNFRWTGFDYLGESFNWPARTANFGIIDLAGFPKDHYYLYQSLWSDQPMVHLLPHWSHKGKEGVKIPVVVYTNCDEAELFLNGASLGRKPMNESRQIVWQVPYQKGELKAVAYMDDKIQASKTIKTAEEAYTTTLTTDKRVLQADRKDVLHCEVSVVDQNGVFVPDASNELQFKVTGGGHLIGIENGDILDMSSSKYDLNRKAFNGRCLLIIQSNGQKGNIKIEVEGEGLKSQQLIINTIVL
ncbi:glycoside hydrolase family 2 TIM barrel-domain containing protein [Flammeovirga sp. EKP202]|uniref:glycoside hydrolase family 2 TIM barrel-domain containing protein n=1 Tax=Flammeovirga sp. EKP202 TaxID=2770592 RepID=UPI00165F0F17|nr:glycoside hydrolase family 2 TIM barrel-domain containing protein [Flammeovirga sp. EKP202]MBD0402027.1 DUF4982 domain-containing protein [Flammeovirga sp. EKP202]